MITLYKQCFDIQCQQTPVGLEFRCILQESHDPKNIVFDHWLFQNHLLFVVYICKPGNDFISYYQV